MWRECVRGKNYLKKNKKNGLCRCIIIISTSIHCGVGLAWEKNNKIKNLHYQFLRLGRKINCVARARTKRNREEGGGEIKKKF